MGSKGNWVTRQEAAKILGLTVETVSHKAHEGVLTYKKRKGRMWFDFEELQGYKKSGALKGRRLDRQIAILERRMLLVERRVEFLSYITGVDVTGLRTATDEELVGLYREARLAFKRPFEEISPAEIQKWGETFLQISEEELRRLARRVTTRRPWNAFYLLCGRLQRGLRQKHGFTTSDDCKALYRLLERGRRSLGHSLVLATEILGSERPLQELHASIRGGSLPDILDRYLRIQS